MIERGKSDGTDGKWTGSVPGGPGKWTGTNPTLPMAGTWKPWVLSSPGEFRPAPPIAYDSPKKSEELAELKNFPRTPQTNNEALFWEAAVGVTSLPPAHGTIPFATSGGTKPPTSALQLIRQLWEYRLTARGRGRDYRP